MALLVHNLALGLDEPENLLAALAAKKLRVEADQIRSLRIVRKSLDARPGRMRWVYSVVVGLAGSQRRILHRARRQDVQVYSPPARPRAYPGSEPLENRPIVVGAGPAGLFASLLLAEAGYRPIVLERGRREDHRHADIQTYLTKRELEPESNFLFGEGGAGAYSDGKLYTRTHDPLANWLLQEFVTLGAAADVAVNGKPHVGSDRLPGICRNLRLRIEAAGGEVRFGHRVDEVQLAADKVRAAGLSTGERIEVSCMLLGIGHSARDTYAMLQRCGVRILARPFQMGVRIEHPQPLIDRAQYGSFAERDDLEPADYHLVAKGAAGDRDVYTFCMCPGGRVLPTNNQAGTICTNGGSVSARDSGWASAALVTTVAPERFGDSPAEGIAMQESIERACFEAAGADYSLCAQRVADFVGERPSSGEIETSSPIGAAAVDFNALLPKFLCRALHEALSIFAKRIPGFTGSEAVLLGPETRASCPVRIDRNRDTRASVSADNLYPIGEGAGYAGGIISAAVDGLRAAETVIARYAPPG